MKRRFVFACALIVGLMVMSVCAQSQTKHTVLDLLVSGVQEIDNLSTYTPEVQAAIAEVIRRSAAYTPHREKPSGGEATMVYEARVSYERMLVASARTADAGSLAEAFVTELRPCYEWEGYHDCPQRDAEFAAAYQRKHPDSPFQDFLPLLEAHRWICAAEGYDYEKNAAAAARARESARAAARAAARSASLLVRLAGDELTTRGTCLPGPSVP